MVIAIWAVREIARTAWGLMRGPVIFILQLFAALIVLFEEWGWKPLAAALAWLARFAPVARLEAWIASLRPYPSLFVFAAPTALLLPVKFAALWLLAQGHFVKTAIRQRAKRIWVRLKPSIQSFAQSAAEQVKAIVQRVREIMH